MLRMLEGPSCNLQVGMSDASYCARVSNGSLVSFHLEGAPVKKKVVRGWEPKGQTETEHETTSVELAGSECAGRKK